MPFIAGVQSIGSGIRYTLADSDSLFVLPGATVMNTAYGAAIYAPVSNAFVQVAGHVLSGDTAVILGRGANSSNSVLYVLSGGSVTGANRGAVLEGTGRIVNEGSIVGRGTSAISVDVDTGSLVTVVNTGVISCVNSAEASGGYGIATYAISSGSVHITNYGLITGSKYSLLSFGLGAFTIRNFGSLEGDLHLGEGGDVIDNREGRITGVILGNGGNDVFIGNPNRAETFNGGDGVDTIDFRNAGSVIVALDLSRASNGAALGDTYFNVENVFGSQQNDIITGNNLNNVLTGEDGNDWLHGRGGNDILRGGPGADTLAGGAGNDGFQFMHIDDAGDTIMDFTNLAGNNDFFHISAAGFGGGLVAGALAAAAFQSGATNVAGSAATRFIYRTTDNTVWYDADGNGAGAAVLLATLQSGATVTAADFLIF